VVGEQILEVNIRGFHARPMIGFKRTDLNYLFYDYGVMGNGGGGSR
jgi:hypothetical protein